MADDRGYRVQIKFDGEHQTFRAVVAELGLSESGGTRLEALENMEGAIEDHIAALAAEGGHLPEASDLQLKGSSPKLEIQLATPLYRDLAYQASLDGISAEELAKALLAHAIGSLEGRTGARKPRQEDNRPGPRRDRPDDRGDDRGNRGNPRDDRGNQRDDRGGNGRRGREQYRPELDDKANFLEYLRNLEKGGGRGGRR